MKTVVKKRLGVAALTAGAIAVAGLGLRMLEVRPLLPSPEDSLEGAAATLAEKPGMESTVEQYSWAAPPPEGMPQPPSQAAPTIDGQPPTGADAAVMEQLTRHFALGVELLRSGDHDRAIDAFEAVLGLAPTLPEAHVNLGYALLAAGEAEQAVEHFGTAIDLRPMQANAYYGLSEALEALGQREGAMGAMRSFVHLTDGDDPFLTRARSALWEWDEERQRAREAAAAQPAGDEGPGLAGDDPAASGDQEKEPAGDEPTGSGAGGD